jgi:hypothetical protein
MLFGMKYSPKAMVTSGAFCILAAVPVGFFYTLHTLGKGEADANYEPALIIQLVGILIPVLFFGGLALLIIGVVRAAISKQLTK